MLVLSSIVEASAAVRSFDGIILEGRFLWVKKEKFQIHLFSSKDIKKKRFDSARVLIKIESKPSIVNINSQDFEIFVEVESTWSAPSDLVVYAKAPLSVPDMSMEVELSSDPNDVVNTDSMDSRKFSILDSMTIYIFHGS
ncbi:hypothetical protein RIF29_14259 [Crotalaria pallida]|uniref:Uncharacterized protein n=1 Tax=Crotalaria pallida TaxID=3830 RepID=A0AAN9FGK5_CROPI